MMSMKDRTPFHYYLYAILVTGLALLTQSILAPHIENVAFILLYPAVVIVSFYFGFKPAFLSLVMSIIGFTLFFSSLLGHGSMSLSEGLRLVVFTALGFFLTLLIGRSKESRDILKKTNQQLNNIQHALDSSSIVAVTDARGVIKYVNDKFCEISKFTKEELVGNTHKIINSGFHDKMFFENLWKTIKHGDIWQGEILNKAKDGSYYWVDTVITPLLDEKGKPYEFVAIRNDITVRKLAEQELKKAKLQLEFEQKKLRAIIEQMPAAIWVAEAPTGNIIIGNALSRTMMKQPDHPAEKLIEYGGYIGYKNGVQLKAHEWPIAKALLTGKSISNEIIEIERPDGTLGHGRFDASPIFNSEGQTAGAVVIGTDLTDQIQFQKAVEKSEDRLKRATETTGIGVWELDTKTLNLERTPTHDQVYGYEFDPNKNFKFFFSRLMPEDAVRFQKNMSRLTEDEVPQREEYRIMRPDGQIHWIEIKGSVKKDQQGNIVNIIGTVMDITERKLTQGLLENIVEHSPLPIVVCDVRGIVKLWNPAAENLFGWATGEVKGNFIPLIPEEEHAEFKSRLELVAKGQKLTGMEVKRKRKDAKVLDVLASASSLPSGEDIVLLFSDLTKLRKAEESRKKSEKMVQDIIDKSPYVTYIKDRKGKFVLVNSEVEKIFKEERTQIIGKTDFDYFSKEKAQELTQNDQKVWTTGKPLFVEEVANIKGQNIAYMSMKFLLSGNDGIAYALAGISIDISERKNMEDTLRAHEKELEAAVASRDRFLSIASHELKTPLTSIKLQLQLYRRQIEKRIDEYLSEARISKLISDTLRQISSLERLVNDMLDISRINTGKLTYQFSRNDLNEIVVNAIESVGPTVERTGSAISVESTESLYGNFDSQRIEQVIINLLTNAARYGRGKPIHVSISREGDWAVIKVKDEGIGIAPENQERIFDQFERAVNQNDVSGFGLGLYISRKILTAHGGNLSLESELHKGSVFKVTLPLFQDKNEAENLSL